MDRVASTFDVDRAPGWCLEQCVRACTERGDPCTVFATHPSPLLADLAREEGVEIGIHPNFLEGSTQGDTHARVLEFCLEMAPAARSMRTHALYHSSRLFSLIGERYPQLDVDASLFLPGHAGLRPVDWLYDGVHIVRVPYYWEDDDAVFAPGWRWDGPPPPSDGLKVFDFHPVLVALTAFVVALVLARRSLDAHSALYVLDHPNDRSLHDAPTPRGGGLAIAAAVYLAGALGVLAHGDARTLAVLGLAAIPVLAISYADDRSHVPPALRILVHLGAAAGLAAAGLAPAGFDLPGARLAPVPWLALAACVLYVVWMINLYNFMDGMDGFAGGMAAIGFATIALLAGAAGHLPIALTSVAAGAAAAGFLVLNFPPAKLFMGDVGSSLLGLLAAAITLWGERDGAFPLWVGVLVFSPFVVDATVTLARRLLRRERVWQAHRTHFYQRLVRLGWSHRRTVLCEYALMLACGASALLASRVSAGVQTALLLAWVLAYAILIQGVIRLERGRAGT